MSGYLYPWIQWIQDWIQTFEMDRIPDWIQIFFKVDTGYRIGYKFLLKWIQDTGLDTQNISKPRIQLKNKFFPIICLSLCNKRDNESPQILVQYSIYFKTSNIMKFKNKSIFNIDITTLIDKFSRSNYS